MSIADFNQNKRRNMGTMQMMLSPDKFPTHYDPLPRSRTGVSYDAAAILQRDRSSDILNQTSQPAFSQSPRSAPKVKGQEAEDIMRKSSGNAMAATMNLSANRGYNSARPAPRVRPEAEQVALRNAGTMNAILDNGANRAYYTSRPAQRVKPEANGNAVRNGGTMHLVLDSDKNSNYNTSRPQPRVKSEAHDNAVKNKGQMRLVLSSENPLSDDKVARVKPEAQDIYQRNRGTLTSDIYNYGHNSLDQMPEQKIKGNSGRRIAKVGVNGTVGRVLNQEGTPRRPARPQSRVKFEGAKYAKQGKGTIGELLGTHGKSGKRTAVR